MSIAQTVIALVQSLNMNTVNLYLHAAELSSSPLQPGEEGHSRHHELEVHVQMTDILLSQGIDVLASLSQEQGAEPTMRRITEAIRKLSDATKEARRVLAMHVVPDVCD